MDLGNLTILVGKNGAGKSNIIDLFRFLSDIMKIGLEGAIGNRNGIKNLRRWSNGKPFNISINVAIAEENGFSATYGFKIGGHKKYEFVVLEESAHIIDPEKGDVDYLIIDQKWILAPERINPAITPITLALPLISGDERFGKLELALRNSSIYNIFPDTLKVPQSYDAQKPMDGHGRNWLSILKDQDSKVGRDDLVIALKKLTGDIDDVDIVQLSSFLLGRFRHGNGGTSQKAKWFDASQESDGTLRMAGMITALLQSPALPLIGIEEPELTIHPGAIPIIYEYLLQAARQSQVIVTTHSPELLDEIEDIEQIRLITKRGEFTTIDTIAEDQREAVKLGLFSLGEIQRTEGLRPKQLSIFDNLENL